jgi:general secretion pathway protein K
MTARPVPDRTSLPSEQGFVIVAVLWLVAALAALAMIFGVSVQFGARACAERHRA